MIIIVPHREAHKKQIETLKGTNDLKTKVLGAPYFPYDGCTIFVETEGDKSTVENFVNNDPYVKNNLVSNYEIKEFAITSRKQFERMS